MKYSNFVTAFFATIVQFYDYALFGLSAGILAKNFMPGSSENDSIIMFFAIFAIAVIARPIGALIFGYIGDKYARNTAIKIATLIAMISTGLIAFIPTYHTIGYFSTILLVICRMLFLISQGGEIDLTRIYIAEKIGKNRNLANGVVSFCSQLGALLAAIAYHFSLNISNDYAWRINFIVGGLAGFIVLLTRSSLQESELFIKYKARQLDNRLEQSDSLTNLIKANKRNFCIAIICNGVLGGSYNFLIIFLNLFLAKNIYLFSDKTASVMNIILISCYGISALASGFVADRIKPYKQIIISIILVYICYIMLVVDVTNIIYLSTIFVILMAFYSVPLQIIIQSLFKIEHKARLYSLAHAIGGIVLSSTMPFLCMLTWQITQSLEAILAIYLALVSLLLAMVRLLSTSTNDWNQTQNLNHHLLKD